MKKDILRNYTEDDHRQRLLNLKFINDNIKSVGKKHLIANYIQGQYFYDEYYFHSAEKEEAMLDYFKENGIGLVQIHEFGWEKGKHVASIHQHINGKMYFPLENMVDPCKRFLKAAHERGIKVIPYTSTNFYNTKNERFEAKWALPPYTMLSTLAHASMSSPGWRSVIMNVFNVLLDEFEFDGIYNDSGYFRSADSMMNFRYYFDEVKGADDDILAFEDTFEHDGAMEDALSLMYEDVHARGGIVKYHKEGPDKVHSDLKYYDYLWVGEAVRDIGLTRRRTKLYQPYVTPEHQFPLESEDERYLHAIPYLQFPMFRSIYVRGLDYADSERQYKFIFKSLAENGVSDPDAYIEADKARFKRQAEYLKIYKEMTQKGTWVYMECDIPKFVTGKGEDTVMTVYANLDTYVVLANYSKEEENTVRLHKKFVECVPGVGEVKIEGNELVLKPNTMKILKLDEAYEYVDGKVKSRDEFNKDLI